MAGAPQVYSANPNSQQPPPPKRPRKYPYRDGQSQAAQHYDLYEMIRHPHLSRDNRPPDPPPYSKEEYRRKRLEKKLKSKFDKKSKAGSGIALFIKLLFFLFVFPPYFFLYKLPSWFFNVAIPSVIDRIAQAIKARLLRIKALFSKMIHAIVDPFKLLWKNAKARLQGSKEVVAIPVEEMGFFAFIAHGFIQFYVTAIYPIYKALRAAGVKSYRLAKQARQLPGQVQARISAKVVRIKQAPKRVLQGLVAGVKSRCIDPIKRKAKAVQAKIAKVYNTGANRCEKASEAIMKTVLHPVQTVKAKLMSLRARYRKVKDRLQAALQKRSDAIEAHIKKHYTNLKKALQSWILEPYNKAKNAAAERIHKFKARILRPLNVLKRSFSYVKGIRFKSFKMPYMPKFSISLEPYKKLQRQSKKVLESFKQGLKAQKEKITLFLQHQRSRLAFALNLLKAPLVSVRNQIHAKIAKAVKTGKRLIHPFVRLTRYMQKRTRIFLAWVRIVRRYGMHQVQAFADRLW